MPETLFPSEQNGLEVIKEIKDEISDSLPPHRHDGIDGSLKIDHLNIVNKEIGGKFIEQDTGTGYSSTATSYTNVTGMSIATESEKRRFLLMFSASIYHSGASPIVDHTYLTFAVDGTNVGNLCDFLPDTAVAMRIPITIHYITDKLTAAAHTLTVQIFTQDGIAYMDLMRFTAIELI